MIGGAKGIGIGIDFGIPNQYCRATSKPYIEKDVLDSLRVVASAYGKSNDDADRSIVKNLVDASNPFIISNAAFKLNSGFGKYEVDFTSWIQTNGVIVSSDKVQNSIIGRFLYFNSVDKKEDVPFFKVNITLGQQSKLQYNYIKEDGTSTYIVYSESGIYTIPASYFSKYIGGNAWFGFYQIEGTSIIEQIPSFEGAFVTDGIDDLITSTKTVQEMLGGSNEITVVSMIHTINSANTTYEAAYTNCIVDIDSPNNFIRNNVGAIGKTGIYGHKCSNLNAQATTNTSTINNILGDKNDYGISVIGAFSSNSKLSVVGFGNALGASQVAWYWTIIANKVLTTDQINQVIAYFNLDRTLNPDILCNTIKQGITNENHAEFGDKLIDFSGNGRDIQLNNIAWKGDSGIGKYSADFGSFDWAVNISQKQHNKATISLNGRLCNHTAIEVDEMKVNIIGNVTELIYWYIANPDDTTRSEIRLTSGINTLPKSYAKDDGQTYNIGFAYISGDSEITIEQIPSHAGALCLDGVNDFGKVTGMPVYKDYTIIADYERLDKNITNDIGSSSIISKSHTSNQGAFILNHWDKLGILNHCYSFGKDNFFQLDDSDRKIYYQSKYSNQGISINSGNGIDNDKLWLGTFRDNDSRFFNGAIYSLMSFPYSMSEFLIERQLKKHKLGTLYPDMVEFRPVIKSSVEYASISYLLRIPGQGTVTPVIGQYYPILSTDKSLVVYVATNGVDEVANLTINGQEPTSSSIHVDGRFRFEFPFTKSPQKINITIDEYIRYEDIVQPYPVLLRFNDENGNEVSWGGKFRVGSTITRIRNFSESNLLNGLYKVQNPKLNGNNLITPSHVVEKSMVFTCDSLYLLDNNEPKCILSPRLLSIPNSSYKILGYIPDISGHGNHGKINNSAYAEGSGVNEDGSYQFDGVDDFVTIPTLSSGSKQMLMKVNWNSLNHVLYDQRNNAEAPFCIVTASGTIAYNQRNVGGNTYIDGILNNHILVDDLQAITHNIVLNNDYNVANSNSFIGTNYTKSIYAKMSLYDFMLFDEISTDDKIKELNEYVGVEGDVWGILTKLSNSTLISNETLIKNE